MILFTADVHLPVQVEHPLTQSFLSFLSDKARQADTLIILGDLFEVWLGDDLGLTLYDPVIQALRDYTQAGHRLDVCHGNRDFLLGQDFASVTGAQLLTEETQLTLPDGTTAVLLHGDTLCTEDSDYLNLRKQLRNPSWQNDFLAKSTEERLVIARQLRQHSQLHNQHKTDSIMDVTQQGIDDLLARHPQITHIIHGHTHRPAHHQLSDGKHRWVLGDWRPDTQLLISNEQGLTLTHWPETGL